MPTNLRAVGPVGPHNATAPTASAQGAPQRVPSAAATVEMWDMSSGIEQPVDGAALLNRDIDPILATAWKQAQRVDKFIRTTLGRNGLDDNGTPLRIVVHTPPDSGRGKLNNAFWDGNSQRIYVGDGDGVRFKPLGGAADVLMHEATHGIVDSEVHLRYEGQQGGVNESWADVLASLADPDDWLIGEDIFTPRIEGDSIRDMTKPTFGHVSQLPKDEELTAHDYSGVPSLAAVRVADQIGREPMGRIWYAALVDHMHSQSGYAAAARATLDAAATLHGHDSAEVRNVLDAWKSVGVEPRWKRPTVT